jgi:hypothetical protein
MCGIKVILRIGNPGVEGPRLARSPSPGSVAEVASDPRRPIFWEDFGEVVLKEIVFGLLAGDCEMALRLPGAGIGFIPGGCSLLNEIATVTMGEGAGRKKRVGLA